MNGIPGTTSSRIHGLGQLALVGTVFLGAAMGFPGYRLWACLTVSLLLVWMVWMAAEMIRGQRRLPGNLAHGALLGVAFLLACHLSTYIADHSRHSGFQMDGQIEASMLFHVVLLSLGVLLVQAFLGDGDSRVTPRLCGAAILLGAAGTMIAGRDAGARDALVLNLVSGVFIFIAPRWTHRPRRLFWSSSVHVSILLVLGVSVLVMLTLTILWWNLGPPLGWQTPSGFFGRGEQAFTTLWGGSSGSAILGGAVGWLGWLVAVLGLLAAIVWILLRGQWSRTSFFWAAATFMGTLALLAPGGYFLPISAVTFMMTWGLLPRMSQTRTYKRSGLFVVVATLVVAMLMGITRKAGLLQTISQVFDLSDKQTHGIFGFVLAVVLAWWFGARRSWLGIIGVFVAAAIGGLGEEAQRLLSPGRSPEWADWQAHAFGSGLALVLVVPCYLARRGTPIGPGRYATKREKYVAGWIGVLVLVLLFVSLAAWFYLAGGQTLRQWRAPRPRFVLSDNLALAGRKSYAFYGVLNPPLVGGRSSLMTVSPKGILSVWSSGKKIYARLLTPDAGLHRQSVLGQPFGELALRRSQEGRYLVIPKGMVVLAIDVSMAISTGQDHLFGLERVVAGRREDAAVVLFSTFSLPRYRAMKPILHAQFPDTPCISKMPAARRSTEVLRQIQRSARGRLVVLTADTNFAMLVSRQLGRRVDVHLVTPERGSDRKGVTRHESVREFLAWWRNSRKKP